MRAASLGSGLQIIVNPDQRDQSEYELCYLSILYKMVTKSKVRAMPVDRFFQYFASKSPGLDINELKVPANPASAQ